MSKFTSPIGRFRKIATEIGVGNAILYSLNRFFTYCRLNARIFRYIFVAQPVSKQPLTPNGRGTNVDVMEIGPGDEILASTPPPAHVIQSRFDQGAICLGAFKKKTLVGYIWISLRSYQEDEVRCCFVPLPRGRAGWDFDVYLAPEHRFGFAFSRIWDAANAYLRDHGAHWTMSRISAFNAQSLASHYRLGAQQLGSATYIKLANWELMLSSLSPFVYLSTGSQSIPEIFLNTPNPS